MSVSFKHPTTIEEACEMITQDEDALIYGGGTALQILRKQGVLSASAFVDISGIDGLDQISKVDGGLRVGAMVSLRRMETDSFVRSNLPLAAVAYAKVANPRVRNTASVGGNIAHGDYRLDPPVALCVLDARVELTSVHGARFVPVKDFFVDFQLTAVKAGEVVSAIEIPISRDLKASSFVKLSSLAVNDWPCASAAVGIGEPDGTSRQLRFALGALAPTPVSASLDVTGLGLEDTVRAVLQRAEELMDPIADIRGGVGYKRRLGRVAVEEAVRNAWKELPND